jgi:uncharacterized protein YndB with AHSA1/START domain
MANEKITHERVFDAPVEMLWEALTDNERLKEWYFDFKGKFKAEVGTVFEWEGGPPDGKMWLHRGEVLEVIEFKKLVHTWTFPGYTGEARLTWELTEKGKEATLLKMNFEFIEPFDPAEDALHRRHFVVGWNEIVNTLLVNYINKG